MLGRGVKQKRTLGGGGAVSSKSGLHFIIVKNTCVTHSNKFAGKRMVNGETRTHFIIVKVKLKFNYCEKYVC